MAPEPLFILHVLCGMTSVVVITIPARTHRAVLSREPHITVVLAERVAGCQQLLQQDGCIRPAGHKHGTVPGVVVRDD